MVQKETKRHIFLSLLVSFFISLFCLFSIIFLCDIKKSSFDSTELLHCTIEYLTGLFYIAGAISLLHLNINSKNTHHNNVLVVITTILFSCGFIRMLHAYNIWLEDIWILNILKMVQAVALVPLIITLINALVAIKHEWLHRASRLEELKKKDENIF